MTPAGDLRPSTYPFTFTFRSACCAQVALAYQVLQIADKLTLSSGEWALYMLDADWENFAVERLSDSSEMYRVRYVDLENVVVVDLSEVRRGVLLLCTVHCYA